MMSLKLRADKKRIRHGTDTIQIACLDVVQCDFGVVVVFFCLFVGFFSGGSFFLLGYEVSTAYI